MLRDLRNVGVFSDAVWSLQELFKSDLLQLFMLQLPEGRQLWTSFTTVGIDGTPNSLYPSWAHAVKMKRQRTATSFAVSTGNVLCPPVFGIAQKYHFGLER